VDSVVGGGDLSAAEMAAEYATGTPFDIDECVREPIHLLGGIQSHGALVAVDPGTAAVAVASANTGDLLGVPARELLGTPLGDLVGDAAADLLTLADAPLDAPEGPGDTRLAPAEVTVRGVPTRFDVTVYRSDGLVVCEFEPSAGGRPFHFSPMYTRVRRGLLRLQGAAGVTELCQAAVREVREMIGYDRVVVYRFAGDGPGEVIAEEVTEGHEPWLGLWFPASDVPPQARRLYLRNWIRAIADVDDPTVALVPPTLPGTDRPLDLSSSVLRTVSGYHLEYLRNIQVAASMSVSLVKDGGLWGLLACHRDAPSTLTPEQRAACEFFGIALSLQLVALEDRERAARRDAARAALAQVLTRSGGSGPGDLLGGSPNLLDLVDADGAWLCLAGQVAAGGEVPGEAALRRILTLAAEAGTGQVWGGDCLRDLDPDLADLLPAVAGALVLPLGPAGDAVAWFRREREVTTPWAVDPNRPVVTGPGGRRLTPRGSSTVWRETVRGRCLPWSGLDREMVGELWRAVSGRILHRAAELAQANADLSQANAELDSFAYVASHDLKEPLRGIANYAMFIQEDASGLDAPTVRRLAAIRTLAERMDGLLNSLLEFSRLSRSDLALTPVDLDDLVDDVMEGLAPRFQESEVTLRRGGRLPTVSGDRVRLAEVLQNLLSNAAKYAADAGPRWVEVGTERCVPPGADEPVEVVYVRDNGIGIPAESQEDVFSIFRRLHPPGARGGGSGVGLTIARRVVERHGGRLWVESVPGEGTTFRFDL
jgi:chemotaxis family two-component system sensor kinase Cph1